MAEKYIKGMTCMEEKARHVMQKFEMRQPLSELELQYNFKQLRPTLTAAIDSEDLDLHSSSLGDLSALSKKSDEAHSNRLSSTRRSRRSPPQSPAIRKKLHTWVKHPTPDSTDADLAEARKAYRFVSRLVEQRRTDEKWVCPQDGVHANGKGTFVAQHWVPFRSYSANAVDAFTPRLHSDDQMQYEMETSVGVVVAAKLARGNGLNIRVGKNGHVGDVSSAERSTDVGNVSREAEAILSELGAKPLPLSIDDAARNCRVLPAHQTLPTSKPTSSSETHPVVFDEQAADKSKPYIPYAIRTDSEEFKQQLAQLKSVAVPDANATIMCLCRPNDISLDVTYEEVLSIRAPTASLMKRERAQLRTCDTPAPIANPPTTAASWVAKNAQLSPPSPVPTAPSASALRDEFRRCMKRQVTMPSYTVVRDVDVHGQRQRQDGGVGAAKNKTTPGRASRPSHSPASLSFHKAFGPTTPTITPHGLPGKKQFVALTAEPWVYQPHDVRQTQSSRDAASVVATQVQGQGPRQLACDAAVGSVAAVSAPASDRGAAHASSLPSSRSMDARRIIASSSSRLSYHASHESSHEARSAVTDRLRGSRMSSATFDADSADIGTPTWRQVSIPTAGAPSEASDDSAESSPEIDLSAKHVSGIASPAESGSRLHSRSGMRSRARSRASVHGESDERQEGSVEHQNEPSTLRGGGGAKEPSKWRGGAEELRAMRSYIQGDLARTRAEAERLIRTVNEKKQRYTSGHVLSQEWQR